MTALIVLAGALGLLGVLGHFYSRFLARTWGEDAGRTTPAVLLNDGRDYVPTPTPVVFAHHFASIAGAGPIMGPVIAICYGWLPALIWVVLGGVFIGGLHDYLATYMATREQGQSVATVARRVLGQGPFVAFILFLIVTLALVCATFLNFSATALVSMVPHVRLNLDPAQTLFREIDGQVVIGGIASTSVIVITALAPLVGWLYIKKQVAVWKCSLLALAIAAVSIWVGLYHPVTLSENVWKWSLAGYVLMAAGLPVWLFLQSRDFINVHILYVGLGLLVATLFTAALRGGGIPPGESLPALNVAEGTRALGLIWPCLFITIACGAVSGFHSLCAGGTTCKQLISEPAVRRIGYWGMILESALAVCVIGVLLMGATRLNYLGDVHPAIVGAAGKSNPILGFAMAVGDAARRAFGLPIAVGALAGMVLLEGFLVTTLDTAVRLMRYLLEEVWRALFGVLPVGQPDRGAVDEPAGADGLPDKLESAQPSRPPWIAGLARILGHYWLNSGLAVGLTLWFAYSGGIMTLWSLFATANQLLAAFVLGLGAVWLLRSGRRAWYVVGPALFMLVTTGASLVILVRKFIPGTNAAGVAVGNPTLFAACVVLMVLTVYLLYAGLRETWALRRR